MIPKLIHQTAPYKRSQWHPVWNMCQPTWKLHFPEFEQIIWTDSDIDEFVKNNYPQYVDLYNRYPHILCKIDFTRFLILHKYGGIFSDMDIFVVKNFYDVLQPNGISILESNYLKDGLQSCFMVSDKNNDTWIDVINIAKDIVENSTLINDLKQALADPKKSADVGNIVLSLTSDLFLTKISDWFHKLPKSVFNPVHKTTEWSSQDVYIKHVMTGKWADGCDAGNIESYIHLKDIIKVL